MKVTKRVIYDLDHWMVPGPRGTLYFTMDVPDGTDEVRRELEMLWNGAYRVWSSVEQIVEHYKKDGWTPCR